MKKGLLASVLISFLLLNLFSLQLSEALPVGTGVYYTVDNGNYSVAVPMVFSQIKSMPGPGSHWITFNGSGFNLTSAITINVSFLYLDDDILLAPVGTTVLRFYANSTADAALRYFNISGFKPFNTYSLFKDGVFDSNIGSTALGNINFSHVFNAATHLFELVDETIVVPGSSGSGGTGGSAVYFVTIKVIDDVTGDPIAGATVMLEDVSVRTTDSLGEVVFYFLLGTYYPYVLHVSAEGYVGVNMPVRFNDSQTLTVNMSSVSSDSGGGTPGFEFVSAMAGAAICMILLKKKRAVEKK
jgi:hypothetical protein